MINKLALPIAGIALVASIATFFYVQFRSELVYVDINKLVEGYRRTKIEREGFRKKAVTLKANVDSLVSDWQKELKTYEKERSSMTKTVLKLKQELLANKQQQVTNYQQAIQKQIQEEDQKVTQTVINDINDYVKAYGKKKGYTIIFGAGGNGNIMYANETADLTDVVLEALNEEYEGQ